MTTEIQSQVDVPKVIPNFETAYPMEMSVLRLGGVYPRETTEKTVNPYTDELVTEYFGNIGEHCIAVALCSDILTDILGKDNPVKGQIVSRALVHDAGKRFEIMRKEAVKAGKIDDAYSPKSYETIRPILEKAGVASDVIDYMARAGQETGHNSLASFISIRDGHPALITNSLPDMIVHLADDMTFTPIVLAEESAQTAFVTIEERMRLFDFPNRYPSLYREGFGFDGEGKTVIVKDINQAPAELTHVKTYADWQVWVATEICRDLVSRISPQPQVESPSEYIKNLVNARLRQRNESTNQTSNPLTATITIEHGGELPSGSFISRYINFGNTGLTVVPTFFEGRSQAQWEMHFTPEGAENKVAGYEEKYKDVYGYALDHLLRWWENSENFKELLPRPDYLIGTTNQTFYNYNLRLLGPDIWETDRKDAELNRFEIRLHLDRLAQNAEVRRKLEERSKQCEAKRYVMTANHHDSNRINRSDQ